MLQTLDDHKPTQQDRLATPGAASDKRKCAEVTAWRWTPSCLCHSQGWWLDPKQTRPSRLSIAYRKPKAGTCTHRRWTSSWDVSWAQLTSVEHLLLYSESFLPGRWFLYSPQVGDWLAAGFYFSWVLNPCKEAKSRPPSSPPQPTTTQCRSRRMTSAPRISTSCRRTAATWRTTQSAPASSTAPCCRSALASLTVTMDTRMESRASSSRWIGYEWGKGKGKGWCC